MSLRRAFAWKTLQFVVIFIIELGGLAVLARLLTPTDMGIYAAAFALLRFGQFIGNFGLYNVILRQEVLDLDFRRQIVGLTGLACGLVTVLYVIALLVWDFGRPEYVLAVLLPTIPLIALSMPANALLVRDMRFQTQFRLRFISAILFPIVAVPMAFYGMGPVSLAVGVLVSSGGYAVLSVWATERAFMVLPSLRVSRAMFQFASTLFFLNAIREAREASATLLIGKLVGLGGLGQYSRAVELETKANQVISETVMPVLTPHLFNKARLSDERLRFEVLRAIEYITALAWSIAATMFVLGPTVVELVLGDQWTLAGQVFAVMGFALAIRSTSGILSTTAVALKQEAKLLKIALLNMAISLTIVATLAAQNLIMMLVLLIAVQWCVAGFQFVIVSRLLSISVSDLARAFQRSGLVAASAMVGLVISMAAMSDFSLLWRTIGTLSAGVVFWVAGVFAVKHPLMLEIQILVAKLTRPKKPAVPEA